MTDGLEIATINGKQIAVGGIGRLFFEDGFPIHISVDILKEKGIYVSLLHIADELYKNGWGERAIINTLSQDFPDCEQQVKDFLALALVGDPQDEAPPTGSTFIYSKNGYEAQREVLFTELFGHPSHEANESKEKIKELQKLVEI